MVRSISYTRGLAGLLLVVGVLLTSFTYAHTHSLQGLESPEDMQRMRLIDRGDGSEPQWMTFGDAMELSEQAHSDGKCAGFMDITDQPTVESGFFAESMPMVEYFKLELADRPLKQQRFLAEAMSRLNAQELHRTVAELSAFRNRYYKSETGVKAAEYVASRFQGLAKNRSDVRVDLFKHKWPQPSVVATIAGQGPKASEIVVIGGHLDSINQTGFGSANMSAPGADDNASGTATVLEVFRLVVQSGFKPNRTLMFMGYAAEEVGLWGSQEIANAFKAGGKSVVAVMQLDMTGFAGSGSQITFMRDFTNPALTAFTQKLLDTYVKLPWSTDQCGYACSDHASWHKAGFAAVMPFESSFSQSNKAIHTNGDLLARMDFNHVLAFSKLGLAFVTELARD
jgi:leucyl aminopeptidase